MGLRLLTLSGSLSFLGKKSFVSHLVVSLRDPVDCSPLGSSVHGLLQARILEWVAIPFSTGSSGPREPSRVFCIAGGFFTIWASRKELWDPECASFHSFSGARGWALVGGQILVFGFSFSRSSGASRAPGVLCVGRAAKGALVQGSHSHPLSSLWDCLLLVFLITTCLTCNSHTIHIQFTGFQYIHRVVQLPEQSHSRTFPSPEKEILYLLAITPLCLQPAVFIDLTIPATLCKSSDNI